MLATKGVLQLVLVLVPLLLLLIGGVLQLNLVILRGSCAIAARLVRMSTK